VGIDEVGGFYRMHRMTAGIEAMIEARMRDSISLSLSLS
jgi:hypothetical protein